MVVEYFLLKSIEEKDLELLNSNPNLFWRNIKLIDEEVFKNTGIESISIPSKVTAIFDGAFKDCKNLKSIKLSDNVREISDYTFAGCEKLESITLPKTLFKIGKGAFKDCKSLKTIDIPENIVTIMPGAFKNCTALESVSYPKGFNITMVFDGCDFNYCYTLRGSNKIFLCKNLPQNTEDITNLIDFEKFKMAFGKVDYNLFVGDIENKNFNIIADKLVKNKFILPYEYIEFLKAYGTIGDFAKNADFRFIKGAIENLSEYTTKLKPLERSDIFRLAHILGCFSNDKILDKSGKPTEVYVGQKASGVFGQIIRNNLIKTQDIAKIIDKVPADFTIGQEFLNLISMRNNGKLEILCDLIELDNKYPGAFASILQNFDKVKEFKTNVVNGKVKNVDWETAFTNYYLTSKYDNISIDDATLADLYLSKGMEESDFDLARELRDYAKSKKIPKHILKEQLKEPTIIEQIEKLKLCSDIEYSECARLLDELYEKRFTYEWLAKDDEKNGILGVYCDCCATLNSGFNGEAISKYSIISKNLQNLVIKDSSGDIVAKGTIYINPRRGYGVFNEFDIAKKFKKNQIFGSPGEYRASDNGVDEKNRELIFNALMRGVKDFVEKYNSEHPKFPLMQINVGMGHNRLKALCNAYKKATKNLAVPLKYRFEDALAEQRVLYVKEKSQRKSKLANNTDKEK